MSPAIGSNRRCQSPPPAAGTTGRGMLASVGLDPVPAPLAAKLARQPEPST